MKRPLALADVLALMVVSVWGSTFPLIKSTYVEITPLAFTQVRFILATAALVPFVALSWRQRRPTWPDLLLVGLVGVLTFTVYQICFSVGLLYTTASNSSLIIGSAPVFTLTYALLSRLERPSPAKIAGILLAMAGVFILISGGGRIALSATSLQGDLLTLVASVSYGCAVAMSKPLVDRYSSLFVMGVGMALGTLRMLPFCWSSLAAQDWAAVSAATWLKLVYVAVMAAAGGYVAWFWSVGRIGATRTAAYGYFIPVVAVFLSVAFFNEQPTPQTAIGAVIVLVGVALVRWAGRRG